MPSFVKVQHFHLSSSLQSGEPAEVLVSQNACAKTIVKNKMLDADVKPFYQLGKTALHECVQKAIQTRVHSQAHREWIENRPAGSNTSKENEASLFGYKHDNPYAQPKRDWGSFRAPLRDFQNLIHRASLGTDRLTQKQLQAFLSDQLSIEKLAETNVYEQTLGQLILSYFDLICQFDNESKHAPGQNKTVMAFSNVVALAEAVSNYYAQNKARHDNPYILGLSDTDLEVALRLSVH